MAVLSDTHPTLLDVQKRLDSNGNIDKIVEMLNQTNEVLEDAVFLECNDGTSHKTTVRTGIPDPTWRKLYGGVQPTKSRTSQVRETTGMLEAYSEVDKALADLNGNKAAFLLSEEAPIVEGMNQTFVQNLFYGDAALSPEKFTGLAPRYSSISAANGDNLIVPSGVAPDNADNASIWLMVWGPQTVHCLYPKGSIAGLQREDKGQVTSETAAIGGGLMEVYRAHYRWDMGLSVRDWRYVVRIQFNQEDLTYDGSSGPLLFDLMTQASEIVPSLSMGRPAFYMNRKTRSFLRRQTAQATKNSTLSTENIAGKMVTMFDGIPVRRCDQLLNTEAGVS